MIIVRRSATVNKLQRNMMSISSSSPISSSPLPISSSTGSSTSTSTNSTSSSSSNSTCSGAGTGGTGGGQFDWAHVLSEENKRKTISLLSEDRGNSVFKIPMNDPSYRKAAVLIPICLNLEGKPSFLYNLRSANLNKHRGEISFPGGGMDPGDKNDPIKAALRETHEELGISSEAIEIWTTLRYFPTIASNLGVIPVLGFLNGKVDPKALKINPEEVEHAFTVSLEHLSDPSNWAEGPERKFKGIVFNTPTWKNLKVFSSCNGADEVVLWGLTGFITHLTLKALLPPEVYTRQIPTLYLHLNKNKNKGHPDNSKL